MELFFALFMYERRQHNTMYHTIPYHAHLTILYRIINDHIIPYLCFPHILFSQGSNGPRWTPAGQFAPQPVSSNPRAIESPRQEAYKMRMQAGNQANFVS